MITEEQFVKDLRLVIDEVVIPMIKEVVKDQVDLRLSGEWARRHEVLELRLQNLEQDIQGLRLTSGR